MIKILIIFLFIPLVLCIRFHQKEHKDETNADLSIPDEPCVGDNIDSVTIVKSGHIRVRMNLRNDCFGNQDNPMYFAFAYKDNQFISSEQLKESVEKLIQNSVVNIDNNLFLMKINTTTRSQSNNIYMEFKKLDKNFKYKIGIASIDNKGMQISLSRSSYPVDNQSSNLEIILIVILAILLFITFILLAILLYINYSGENRWQNVFLLWSKSDKRKLIRRENGQGYNSYRGSIASFPSFHEQEFEIKSHVMELSGLSDTIPLMIENGVLKQEFGSVFRGQLMKWEYGKQVQHKGKNRYGNLLPYDHSRVVLEIIDNDANTDYINANYVEGYKCPNRYVATQGPLPNTLNDMWRMIWQLDSHQIVMLTSLDEGGKNKCDKYWPEDRECTYGLIKITLTKTEIFADYIVRTFNAEKEGTVREIVQYHFISWPDHTVPMYSCSLLTFIGRVRSSVHYKPAQPIIVHCSAGVGRTGTFILIDAMLEMAKNEKQIDVLKHFCVIRQQRINLVEKLQQYVFVHQALLEALSHESTSIDCKDFLNYYTKMITNNDNNKSLPLLTQFQVLNKLSPQAFNPDLCQCARAHPHLNRNQDIIPPDYARVILPIGSDEDYINAVYINGYKRRDAYIVTQVPLESNQQHFWQLIASTTTKTIVLLNDIKQENQIYWPTIRNKQLDFNDIQLSVQLISEENYNSVTIRVFHLPQNDLTVKQFHLKGWPALVNKPPTAQVVIDLMEMVEQWNLQSNSNGAVIQCFDGNQASGVFCATSFLCDRIKEEQVVDVFLAVQTVRTNRPKFIIDLDQYKFLHQLAVSYLQHFDTYANFK